uniref:Uncharacterized protein n=1 Tax=Guadeloupe mosquito quaranja-like virus 1 TaxID=2607737 RepID=A0A894KMK1_9ORTO|nr:MAG: hypothetical protein 3 [Guadeloupe mosquito quaranja-like virus 1]QRW42612.1 MAG: hypothetical protein 3 [Guadeloupe mosquito quaranja-like virus 1]QRW42613.1 MAG: hypothetical protein 3 [Guadeloupe mosquito quaranja-like virus 1]QRW42614.1 MAG: hypothetical protein 3 [Guadeloupe mosquito quaranja-like virus 1]QRW42615.1 MAG: hypothetical protein 3 [Guadeloupe mosquito quaranja-like virus 1]
MDHYTASTGFIIAFYTFAHDLSGYPCRTQEGGDLLRKMLHKILAKIHYASVSGGVRYSDVFKDAMTSLDELVEGHGTLYDFFRPADETNMRDTYKELKRIYGLVGVSRDLASLAPF